MATPREIRNRIQSVQNTRKITRTMELVSTAKSKRAVDRVHAAQPFSIKIEELLSGLAGSAKDVSDPLLRQSTSPKKAIIMIVTSNRGLCGGFNSNTIRLGLNRRKELIANGTEVEVVVIGKKAANFLKFLKVPVAQANFEIGDKPTFDQAREFADSFMERFSSEEIDLVEIVYTRYYNAGSQKPFIKNILPLQLPEGSSSTSSAIFEPDAESIIKALLPRAIRVGVYQTMIESVAGEHIARRIAMKNATSAAGDMIRSMTRQYNRVRQAKITQEIAEIVSGAEAIS